MNILSKTLEFKMTELNEVYIAKVTREDVDHAESIYRKYNSNGRDAYQKRIHSDCEFPERVLSRLSSTGYTMHNASHYDLDHKTYGRCELKQSNDSNFVTVKDWCTMQDFDTFVIWEWLDKPNDFLEEGDIVKFRIKEITPKNDFLKRAQPSKYENGGYFVRS